MKNRLLTALVGLSLAVGWLFLVHTVVFSAVLAVVALIAEYEMLKVFNVKNLPFRILAMATAAGVVLFADYKNNAYVGDIKLDLPVFPLVAGVVLLSLIFMVFDFEGLKFEQVACSLFAAFLTSAALSCVILFRDVYITWENKYTQVDGIFFILLGFFASWMSDAFALFAGKLFGKHKLAPKISPKKTVEGMIGGVICNCILCVALYFVMKKCFALSDSVTLVFTIVSALALSLISVIGDLAASTIKRHHGVKDFGNLLPGHGGIMDRFDSSVFVFAALYGTLVVINSI